MIVIVEKNFHGNFEFTKEELEELLLKARQEGYDEGYKLGVAHGEKHVTYPTMPTTPFKYDKIEVVGTDGTGSGNNPELGKTKIIA